MPKELKKGKLPIFKKNGSLYLEIRGFKNIMRGLISRLECFCGCKPVVTLKRVYPNGKTLRARSVDYRHVVHSLVKKPQAFRYSQLRDDLLPSDDYQRIWQYIDDTMEAKSACRFMTGVLYLAASCDCEVELAQTILAKIEQGVSLSLSSLQAKFAESKDAPTVPVVNVVQHSLQQYDELLIPKEVCHA